MPTLVRVRRNNVDASPNQFATNSNTNTPFALDGYRLTNSNTTDVYVHFYQDTSGSVTVGTSSHIAGPVLVPAASSGYATQVYVRAFDYKCPEAFAKDAIVVAATTTETGSTSPTADVTVEIFYWRF